MNKMVNLDLGFLIRIWIFKQKIVNIWQFSIIFDSVIFSAKIQIILINFELQFREYAPA